MGACARREERGEVRLEGVQVLVVEDSKLFRGIYQIYLGELKCEVEFASHGWEALAYLRQRQPQVIILDVDMPEMDGPTFMRYFSKTSGYKWVPVVLATSRDPGQVDAEVLGMAKGYLKKPFGPTALTEKLREVLGG